MLYIISDLAMYFLCTLPFSALLFDMRIFLDQCYRWLSNNILFNYLINIIIDLFFRMIYAIEYIKIHSRSRHE